MKKNIYILIIALGCNFSAQAQFFKKLKEKVEKKVENAVTESISDKAEKETQAAMDKMLEDGFSGMSMGLGNVDPALIRDTYDFDWKYVLNMETEDGEMKIIYRLKKDAPYMGFELPEAAEMFMVMDQEKELIAMYMKSGESKFITATKIPEVPENETAENPNQDQEIKKISTKTILGYESQGYQTEDEEYIYTFYLTDEAGISFNDMFKTNQKNMPKDFNAGWLKEEGGLLMEMEMKSKTNPEENMLMTCTEVEKEDFVINKSDYSSMGGE